MRSFLWTDNDIVDWNVDEFDEETDEAHDAESNSGSNSNLLEFTAIWFCAPFHQTNGIFGEQTAGLTEANKLIHFFDTMWIDEKFN